MKFALPFLAWLAGYLIGSLSFAVIVSRRDGPGRPAQLRLGQPGRDQRAALGQQEGGGRDAASRRAQGRTCRCSRRAGRRSASGSAARRSSGAPRSPASAPSSATSGRSTSASRAARAWPPRPACCWRSTPARPGDAGHLDDHRGVLPLLVAGLARLGRVRAVLAAADLGRRADRARGHRPDVLLLVWRHGGNIRKLLAGTESKLGRARPSRSAAEPDTHRESARTERDAAPLRASS